jgi:hypothetical protein
VQKGHGTRTLYGAMNQRVSRNFGLATRTTKPFDPAARRVSSAKPIGDDRTIRSLDKRRAVTGTDPRVIRGKPARASKDVRVVSPRVSRQTKEIRSGNGSYREQRVIRRVQGTKRTAAGNKQPSVTTGRAGSKPVRIEQKATDQRRTSRTGLAPNTTKQRPETRGTYKPNVRRSGGEKGATPRATRSSPRSSNSGSKASAPRRTSSSNSSKGSSRERR